MITGGDVRIEKDPDMTKLAQEARRLSMGTGATGSRRSSGLVDDIRRSSPTSRRASGLPDEIRRSSPIGNQPRRPSEGFPRSPRLSTDRRQSDLYNGNGTRRSSDLFNRRPSGFGSNSRRESSSSDHEEVERRRLSEAGMRRSSTADVVLNEDTSNLTIGQQVWVDGTKHGRIAYIGDVHFAKGEIAGVHLEAPVGKNNGTVGGIMYFQCEPKHGIFARLHRLTREPLIDEEGEDFEYGH